MISFDEARKLASSRIAELENVAECELVVLEEKTKDVERGWLFFYDSKLHQETGEFRYALAGNGPIFIDRNGTLRHLPTYTSWQEGLKPVLAEMRDDH
ncbi:YrhB domain-containing protein [Bradyrhizobium sp. SZCCHNRI1009]|uniref:YrhB domain-containing protein n=1 Tax=Bradyrhizobium sp. SZCCHNRI1009 TaxID=3057277 RepID=UPI0029168A76|nr:YrhB domain-containing protein [Bradyrhizobium sp. SZCCHNRI1009]